MSNGAAVRSRLARAATCLALALAAVLTATGPAAASASAHAQQSGASAPGTVAGSRVPADPRVPHEYDQHGVCSGTDDPNTTALPVYRWSEGTDFHSRLGTKAWDDVAEKVQRQGWMEAGMSFGNVLWSTSAGMVQLATTFCPLDRAGGAVDQAAGTIGEALLDSGIVVALVVAALVVYAWRLSRGAGAGAGAGVGRMLVGKALILALFAVMVAGAMQSVGGGADGDDGAYVPGVGSPGWFATTVDSTVSSLAGSVTSALGTRTIDGAESGPSAQDPLSCTSYVRALKQLYVRDNGKHGTAGTPLMLSAMWEQTGLEAWKQAQFGTNNGYGDYMYCRMLDANTGQPTRTSQVTAGSFDIDQQDAMDQVDGGFPKLGDGTLAWNRSLDNKKRDRGYIAWASCRLKNNDASNLDNPDGFTTTKYSRGVLKDADGVSGECHKFFNETGYNGDFFDWDDSDDDIGDVDNPAAKDFILTLHGNKNVSGLVLVMVYCISSVLMFAVFAIFAIAIILAKVAALVMMLFVLVMLLLALLPSNDASRVTGYAKQYVGLSLFAFGAQLLLAVLALLTAVLVDIGTATMPGGEGGFMALVWTGMAPFIAAVCMHIGFKKMKVPSPFTPAGGMSWGKAAASGAIGGAAAGGTASMLDRGLDRAGRVTAQKGKQAVAARMPGSKERKNKMAPAGADKQATNQSGTSGGQNGQGSQQTADTTAGTSGDDAATPDGTSDSGAGTEAATAGAGGAGGAAAAGTDAAAPDGQGTGSRAEQARADREEREAAKSWAEANSIDTPKHTMSPTQHAKNKLDLAREQFRTKPLATTGKVAGAAALGLSGAGLAGLAAAPAAYGAAKMVGTDGLSNAARGVGRSVADRTPGLAQARRNSQQVDMYRQHQAEQARIAEQRRAAEQARNRAQDAADGSGSDGGGDASGSDMESGERSGGGHDPRAPVTNDQTTDEPYGEPAGYR